MDAIFRERRAGQGLRASAAARRGSAFTGAALSNLRASMMPLEDGVLDRPDPLGKKLSHMQTTSHQRFRWLSGRTGQGRNSLVPVLARLGPKLGPPGYRVTAQIEALVAAVLARVVSRVGIGELQPKPAGTSDGEGQEDGQTGVH
jgi:hypothetical protein